MVTGLQTFHDDAGRSAYFDGRTGDCVTRAIVLATGRDYKDVYDDLFELAREMHAASRARWAKSNPTPRTGVHRQVYERYLDEVGWLWVPTMKIGTGCTVHLAPGELPPCDLIARVSKHICFVEYDADWIPGASALGTDADHRWKIRDTGEPSREGTRCVYGYYREDTIENEVRCRSHETALTAPAGTILSGFGEETS